MLAVKIGVSGGWAGHRGTPAQAPLSDLHKDFFHQPSCRYYLTSVIHLSAFQGKAFYRNVGPRGLFCWQVLPPQQKRGAFDMGMETWDSSLLGGRGPWSSSGYRTVLPWGWLP